MWDSVIAWLAKAFCWIVDGIEAVIRGGIAWWQEGANLLLDQILGARLPGIEPAWNLLGPYIVYADQWFPIHEGIVLVTAWVGIQSVLIIYRLGSKFVPLGGA